MPAYRAFVDERGGQPRLRYRDGLPDLTVVPETDKASYVRRYDHEARCIGGRMPRYGVVVDESSGSSGRPTSWVRGPTERWATKSMLQLAFRSALGERSFFVINAFALGAWATGLNVTLSLNDICIMKSTGPDIDKIVHTLEEFGSGHDYVVMGYPPFLKTLSDDRRIDWGAYRVSAVFGGEAMSESMRRYLLTSFNEVLGSYGASDLEINMAAESPFTIRLR
ncbi:MAG: CoF synthetase, partial [Actinomycetota bacterium]|nr:CoF synthetase [Actinomycetota bacterium]